jgi:hypothetical protein
MIRINYGRHITFLKRRKIFFCFKGEYPLQIIHFGDIREILFTPSGSWMRTNVEFDFCLN